MAEPVSVFVFAAGPKRLTDCTREELLTVIGCLAGQIGRMQRNESAERRFVQSLTQKAQPR